MKFINKKLSIIIHKHKYRSKNNDIKNIQAGLKQFLVLSYYGKFSQNLKKLSTNFDFKIMIKINTKLRKYNREIHKDAIYKINCIEHNCNLNAP